MKLIDKLYILCVVVSFLVSFIIAKLIFNLPNKESIVSASLTSIFINIYLGVQILKQEWKNL